MSNAVAIDFETFFSKRLKYTIKKQIAEQYCRHHLFDAYLVSVSDGKNAWAGHPKNLNWSALDGKVLLSHNAYFDRSVYNELVRRGIVPKISFPAWHCTANMTSYLCNRRSLEQSVEYLMKIKLTKHAREDADGKRWPDDFSPEAQKAMLEYARRDAFYCWKLFNDFGDQWPEKERRLADLTIRQGMRGVQIDRELLDQYICQSHEMRLNTEKLIPWIAEADDESWDDFNTKPTSTKCIAEQCRRSGIPCPPVKEHEGEEAYEEWENTYKNSHPWVAALTSWRSVNKLYQTFLVVKERLRDDGTMPFGLKYFGAHTGRWAGDARVNMQNMRKKPIFCNEFGLMEASEKRGDAAIKHKQETGAWPEWVKYAIDFRHLVIPRPGKKMIVSDLSQIEPRVLAWLVKDTEFLKLVSSGMSPYEAHARITMGWTGGKLKDADLTLYSLAKARVLALGYGCGWEKFILMAQEQAQIDITEGDPEFITDENGVQVSGYGSNSRRIVAEYRAQNPKIAGKQGLWQKLDEMFKRSIGGTFTMTLPSGRKMRYNDVKCVNRIVVDPETGKPKRKTEFTCDIGGRRVSTYGGKLTENITQAVARDGFCEHVLALDETPGIDVLFTSHDEAITEVDNDVQACDVQRIMSVCPEWLPGCPIAAEAKEVSHYEK